MVDLEALWLQVNSNVRIIDFLVGGWTNPFEKYAHQIESFPQGSGWKYIIFDTTT